MLLLVTTGSLDTYLPSASFSLTVQLASANVQIFPVSPHLLAISSSIPLSEASPTCYKQIPRALPFSDQCTWTFLFYASRTAGPLCLYWVVSTYAATALRHGGPLKLGDMLPVGFGDTGGGSLMMNWQKKEMVGGGMIMVPSGSRRRGKMMGLFQP